jgi:hypothetical protein
MKNLYCKNGFVIAHHDEGVSVPDNAYPDAIVIPVPDDYVPVYEAGSLPMPGMPDTRRELAPVFDLNVDKDRAQSVVKNYLDNLSNSITQYNPQAEVLSWPAKEAAARSYLSTGDDDLTDTQKILLNSELSASGSTDMAGLCNSIIAKALLFAKVAGSIAGLRTSTQTLIGASENSKELTEVMDDFKDKVSVFSDNIAKTLTGIPISSQTTVSSTSD